jgi:hypothetical protein
MKIMRNTQYARQDAQYVGIIQENQTLIPKQSYIIAMRSLIMIT